MHIVGADRVFFAALNCFVILSFPYLCFWMVLVMLLSSR